jgi:hypothetical protein
VSDVYIEEISKRDSRRIGIRFIEQALEALSNEEITDHEVQHVIFDLNTAIAYFA